MFPVTLGWLIGKLSTQRNDMKTKFIQYIHLVVLATVLSFVTGCGSSNQRSIDLAENVRLEMVRLPNNLWFGKYEVTQLQWKAVIGGNGNRSKFKNPSNPKENVSWDDCQAFLKKLNALPSVKDRGLTFRLPTEEEWVYACRAGATGDYCKLANGTEITKDTLGQIAWFEDNAHGETHPVGQKLPNAFGLYDMHGNVWEWTSTEWTSTVLDECRVILGGSWNCSARDCESFNRDRASPSRESSVLGFRLCAGYRAD